MSCGTPDYSALAYNYTNKLIKVDEMERIKQAIERAKHEQVTIRDVARPEKSHVPSSSVKGLVSYTTTRVVPTAPTVLRHNKIISGIYDEATVTAYNMLRTQVLQRLHEHNWLEWRS